MNTLNTASKNNLTAYEKHKSMPTDDFAIDVIKGFEQHHKALPSKYFYDDIGSKLFQKITQHPDYYLTRTELSVLNTIKHILPKIINESNLDIIELGAGDGHKTQVLINGFLDAGCNLNYFPIDISAQAMEQLKSNLEPHENLHFEGIVEDYFKGLNYLEKHSDRKKLVLFLGSNIGNFSPIESQIFLQQIAKSLGDDHYFLCGFDMKKDVNVLTKAYNDSSELTKAFNLNILKRINIQLGGNFDIDTFYHHGVYNPALGAMESYLISTKKQSITLSAINRTFHFDTYEPIHLEYSYKYSLDTIGSLCHQSGFNSVENFSDDKDYFVNSLWQANKINSN